MPVDLDVIEARLAAASVGPWSVEDRLDACSVLVVDGAGYRLAHCTGYHAEANAAFIMAARSEMPMLLAAVRQDHATRLRRAVLLGAVENAVDEGLGPDPDAPQEALPERAQALVVRLRHAEAERDVARALLAKVHAVVRGVACATGRLDDIEWRPVLVAEAKRLLPELAVEVREESDG